MRSCASSELFQRIWPQWPEGNLRNCALSKFVVGGARYMPKLPDIWACVCQVSDIYPGVCQISDIERGAALLGFRARQSDWRAIITRLALWIATVSGRADGVRGGGNERPD